MIKSRAFTMIEMIVVLGIIAFILAFVGPAITKRFGKSQVAMTKMKMSKLKSALLEYRQDMGHYPKSQKEGGFQALLTRPNVANNEKWDGPYIESEEDLQDSWSFDLEYNNPPQKYRQQYKIFEIISIGGEAEEAKEIVDGV